MSLYNMIHGMNPIAFFVLPMLGDKHPDEWPRFRDVFLKDEEHPEYDMFIHVYTRVGGGNRNEGYGEEELYKHRSTTRSTARTPATSSPSRSDGRPTSTWWSRGS